MRLWNVTFVEMQYCNSDTENERQSMQDVVISFLFIYFLQNWTLFASIQIRWSCPVEHCEGSSFQTLKSPPLHWIIWSTVKLWVRQGAVNFRQELQLRTDTRKKKRRTGRSCFCQRRTQHFCCENAHRKMLFLLGAGVPRAWGYVCTERLQGNVIFLPDIRVTLTVSVVPLAG